MAPCEGGRATRMAPDATTEKIRGKRKCRRRLLSTFLFKEKSERI